VCWGQRFTEPEVDEDDETGADVRRLCYRSGGASSPPAGEIDACASGTGATGIGPGGPGSLVLDILATVRDAYGSQSSAVWIATALRNDEAPPGDSWATIVSEGAAVLTLRTMRTCSVDGVNCLGTLGSGRSMLTSAKPRVVPTPIPDNGASQATEGVFPNPFNGEVVVRFVAPARGDVSIRVFDIRGRQVYVASLGTVSPGVQDWRWSGTDQRGTTLASGIYAVRIDGAAWARTWKVMLAK
jgi:hypothetical protein